MSDGEITQYGFRWKQAEVVRAWEHREHIAFQIRTKRQWLTIRVTPSGIIRVDDPSHAAPATQRERGHD